MVGVSVGSGGVSVGDGVGEELGIAEGACVSVGFTGGFVMLGWTIGRGVSDGTITSWEGGLVPGASCEDVQPLANEKNIIQVTKSNLARFIGFSSRQNDKPKIEPSSDRNASFERCSSSESKFI
jgi:hypothetical protein